MLRTTAAIQNERPAMRPLIVDLDGTLIKTDLLVEGFLGLMTASPANAMRALFVLPTGKAAFKECIADQIVPDPSLLPYNESVLDKLQSEKRSGREIYLVSASDERNVEAVANYVGLFEGAIGSKNGRNLSAEQKAAMLVEKFGEKGFDYIGNGSADIPVWKCANQCYLAGVKSGATDGYFRQFENMEEVGRWSCGPRTHLKAIRLHQWLKNLLVFVPMLMAHQFDLETVGRAVLAFLSFSLCASSVYVTNDLLDLQNDRTHARKKFRPLASGLMPHSNAILLAILLLGGAFIIGALLPPAFLVMLSVYLVTTFSYSVYLKRIALVDVSILAVLYTIRIFAGGLAVGIQVSEWLMAFSVFFFLFLAIVKRYTELGDSLRNNKPVSKGRGFVVEDLPILGSFAAAAGNTSVLVLALYTTNENVSLLYRSPELLWGASLLLLFWINRMLFMSHRGLVHDDPIIFAATDRVSIGIGVSMGLVFFASIFL